MRLLGDDRQLAAIAAGGVLRDIAEEVGASTLTTVVRFTDPAEAAATLAVRDGDPSAVGFYLDHGRVHAAPTSAITQQVCAAWAADTDAGLDSVMVAATKDTVAQLNTLARAHRLAATGQPAGPHRTLPSRALPTGVHASRRGPHHHPPQRPPAAAVPDGLGPQRVPLPGPRPDRGRRHGGAAPGHRPPTDPARRITWTSTSTSATPAPCTASRARPWTPATPC